MKRAFILILLLYIIAAQYSMAQPAHLSFDHIDVKAGLPDNDVRDMTQDYQGYMWFVTQNGVARYDGYQLKVYKPGIEDKTNLPNFFFSNIFEDKNHNLWANSLNNGLFRYDRPTDRFVQYRVKNYPYKGSQTIMCTDSAGKIWSDVSVAGFDHRCLQQFDPATGVFKRYGIDQKGAHHLNCKYFRTILVDRQGKIWLGTNNGLYCYNPGTDSFTNYQSLADDLTQNKVWMIYQAPSTPGKLWISITNVKDKKDYLLHLDIKSRVVEKFGHLASDKNSLGDNTVSSVYEDRKHRIWMGTNFSLSLYNDKTKQFTNYIPIDTVNAPYKNHVYGMIQGRDHNLWMMSEFGLICFNPETGQFRRYIHDKDEPASISNVLLAKILFDRDGLLWVAMSFGGADRIDAVKSAFAPLYVKDHKLPWNNVTTITKAPDGHLWIGAENGLFCYDSVTQTTEQITNQLAYRVCVAKNGLVYYSAHQEPDEKSGLGVYDPQTKKRELYQCNPTDTTSISDFHIVAIHEDRTGLIWVGTNGRGICAFNPHTKKFKRYPYIYNDNSQVSHDELDDNAAFSIYEDRSGTLWVGTSSGGLNHLDRKRDVFVSSFIPQEAVNSLLSINQDNKGRLWTGSQANGLFLVDNNTGRPLKRITEKDGLLSDFVPVIHADKNGFLWLGSARGFSKVNTDDFSIKTYRGEGRIWDDIFSGYYGGISEIGDNVFIFNANNIITFDTRVIKKDMDAPLVHITNVSYSDSRLTKDSSITMQTFGQTQKDLPWNQNKITFSYVAIHYINPNENKYSYRLQGYDNHWIPAGSQRSTTYTNLSPGTYTFKVKAANGDGVWNNQGDSFIIIISPPWWQTWWAWAFYVILLAASVYAFVAYRSRKLIREKRELEEKVTVRTKQLSQANKELHEKQEEIISQRDQLSDSITNLQVTQKQLIQSEKMASLGELTAGIAHEIQNPLNFVNNFSEVSRELMEELKEELDKGDTAEARAISVDVIQNLEKINHHGKRADGIVKGMLEHSQTRSGSKEPTDLNTLADECMRISYHGLKAKEKLFDAELITHFDTELPNIQVVQQDISRVLLNLFNNAFYAVNQKIKTAGKSYTPEVSVTTSFENGKAVISIKDNGIGVPEPIKEKIMQPFFTTKPTGEGTGLGLSLTYDMVVKGHGGNITFNSKEGDGSEFTISLPVA